MGCLIGALSLSLYGDRLGRRKTTFTGAAITVLGQALQVSATTLAQFVVGRVILGFAIGQISGTVPVWLSECAPTKYRGQLGICTGIFISTGYALCNWIDLGFSYLPSSTAQWRAPLAIPSLFSAIMLLAVFTFPESPRWLVSQGRVEDATASLTQYRGSEPPGIISREIASIELALESTSTSSVRDIFNRNDTTRLHYRFWLCMGLNFFQQACGGNLISVYSSTIFQTNLHMSPTTAKILASSVFIWKTLCCLISVWAIDRLGRRACFMISGTGMALCMAVLAITTSFPTITYLVTPVAIERIGFGYYVIYVGVSGVIPVMVYLFYPETMGRSLEMLDRVFVEAESVWRIVPMARGLPRGVPRGEVEGRLGEDKRNAAGEVEMREYV
ncbi:MFS general substrate transporter [Aspergillus ibericus CBS 121593]|uniref:MFS general substrate transporter n=1 Tax=Aspergillus ibericus CBS 121593 TaxID=1448316 RepID=A0A395GLS5_9EURO|nr:MFS general substrate transporter [Aspergillus ibericus CBS 121593]RAK96461.1 MFS general substrate transporter [Aspergillus ibericus CBS 121593]